MGGGGVGGADGEQVEAVWQDADVEGGVVVGEREHLPSAHGAPGGGVDDDGFGHAFGKAWAL